jgi:hypothetical protein
MLCKVGSNLSSGKPSVCLPFVDFVCIYLLRGDCVALLVPRCTLTFISEGKPVRTVA